MQRTDIITLLRPFADFINYWKRADVVHLAACRGLLTNIQQATPPEQVDTVFDQQVTLLNGPMVVALWSSLETLIRDFLEAWMATTPDAMPKPEKAIRGDLVAFAALSPAEQRHELLRLLEQDRGQHVAGVNRFEALLKAFGLGGPVEPSIRDTLYELWCVRNVVAHCRGIADARFVKALPQKPTPIGELVPISIEDSTRYYLAAGDYGSEVVRRITARFKEIVGQPADPSAIPPDMHQTPPAPAAPPPHASAPPAEHPTEGSPQG